MVDFQFRHHPCHPNDSSFKRSPDSGVSSGFGLAPTVSVADGAKGDLCWHQVHCAHPTERLPRLMWSCKSTLKLILLVANKLWVEEASAFGLAIICDNQGCYLPRVTVIDNHPSCTLIFSGVEVAELQVHAGANCRGGHRSVSCSRVWETKDVR